MSAEECQECHVAAPDHAVGCGVAAAQWAATEDVGAAFDALSVDMRRADDARAARYRTVAEADERRIFRAHVGVVVSRALGFVAREISRAAPIDNATAANLIRVRAREAADGYPALLPEGETIGEAELFEVPAGSADDMVARALQLRAQYGVEPGGARSEAVHEMAGIVLALRARATELERDLAAAHDAQAEVETWARNEVAHVSAERDALAAKLAAWCDARADEADREADVLLGGESHGHSDAERGARLLGAADAWRTTAATLRDDGPPGVPTVLR